MATPITNIEIEGASGQIEGTLTVASGGTLISASGSTVNLSAGTVTLPTITWASVDKTTSSIADITTRSAGDLNSGTLAAARMATMVGDSGSGGTQGAAPAPGAGDAAANKFLKADATYAVPPTMVGDSGSGGTAGYAPAPGAGDAAAGYFLKADGTWASTSASANATQIQSRNVASTAPTDGYALVWNNSLSQWEPQAQAGGGGTKTLEVWRATDGQPPASNYATLDTRNSIAVLDFDDSTDESTVFVGIMPEGCDLSSGVNAIVKWTASSATSGNVVWACQIERCNTDLDTDSFDTAATATGAANGTSGIPTSTTIAQTNIDSVAAGELFRIKVYRDADNASDTMTGDAELIAVELQQIA